MAEEKRKKSQRADGLCEIKRTITYPDGRKKPKSFYGKTLKAAKQHYEDYLIEINTDKLHLEDMYFSEIADRYLATRSTGDTTEVGYKNIVKQLKVAFVDKLIRTITHEDLTLYINSLKNLSINTIKKRITHLKGIFLFALTNGYIQNNPATTLIPPKNCKEAKEPVWYDKKQARQLLNQSKLMGKKGLAIFIPLKIGTRPGETAAINIHRDINFDSKMIKIQETIKIPQSGLKVGKTKTRTSEREIPVDDEFIKHLSKFRDDIDGYIFDNGKGNPVNYGNFLRHYYLPVMESMPDGFPIYHPHDLRHTCGTLLYESGTDLYVIMDYLGHSDIKATQIYVHKSIETLRDRIKRSY